MLTPRKGDKLRKQPLLGRIEREVEDALSGSQCQCCDCCTNHTQNQTKDTSEANICVFLCF